MFLFVRQRRRRKEVASERHAKSDEVEDRTSEQTPTESKVIVVQPTKKRRKYDDQGRSKPLKKSPAITENRKTETSEKTESRKAVLSPSDESELELSDISEDFELSDEEEKYFRVEKSPEPVRLLELEEQDLKEYRRAISSLSDENAEDKSLGSEAKVKRPPRHHTARVTTQSSAPRKLGESIRRKLGETDFEVKPVKPVRHEQKTPTTRDKSVGVHFQDELPSRPRNVDRKTVGTQAERAEKFQESETRKPVQRDVAVAAVSVTTTTRGAQTEQLPPTTEHLPQTHAPVLPPDIFLNLKFPKLDTSNPEAEIDTQTALDGPSSLDNEVRSAVAPRRQFLSVADMDTNQWSEIQMTPNVEIESKFSELAEGHVTPSVASRDSDENTDEVEMERGATDDVFRKEERRPPGSVAGTLIYYIFILLSSDSRRVTDPFV